MRLLNLEDNELLHLNQTKGCNHNFINITFLNPNKHANQVPQVFHKPQAKENNAYRESGAFSNCIPFQVTYNIPSICFNELGLVDRTQCTTMDCIAC